MWEGAGGSLKLWLGFWLERGAGWTGRTNHRGLERLCGFIKSFVGLRLLGAAWIWRGNRCQIDEYGSHKPSSEISDRLRNLNV